MSHSAAPARPYSALVVDDEPMLVTLMRRFLVPAGFVVVTAGNGYDAIAVLSESAPDIDVVLCDLLMPGNGSTLARHLRSTHPEVSLVVMTGLDDFEAARRAMELGAVACLTKPFESAQHVVDALSWAAEMTRARRNTQATDATCDTEPAPPPTSSRPHNPESE